MFEGKKLARLKKFLGAILKYDIHNFCSSYKRNRRYRNQLVTQRIHYE